VLVSLADFFDSQADDIAGFEKLAAAAACNAASACPRSFAKAFSFAKAL
jgi:hypothetical protein